jgi:hypothetical protein
MKNQVNSSDRAPKEKGVGYSSWLVSSSLRSGLVCFAVGLILALLVGWVLFPIILYSHQEQPLDFSHAIHTDPDVVDGIDGDRDVEICLYCHSFRDDGYFTGIPKLEVCMECHDDPEYPWGESPEEEKLLSKYVAEGKEIPWLSYFRQPDSVYFSHIAHVKMGNIDCRICHGDHAETHQLPAYKKNRMTGYSINIWGENVTGYKSNTWDRMKMDDCAECHTESGHEENNDCFVCHK